MQSRLDPKSLYHISTKKAPFAVGRPLPGGRFLVYANSRAALDPTDGLLTAPDSAGKAMRRKRDALIALGVLSADGNGHLAFAQDFAFKSCHEAAAIIRGSQSANGYDEWRRL